MLYLCEEWKAKIDQILIRLPILPLDNCIRYHPLPSSADAAAEPRMSRRRDAVDDGYTSDLAKVVKLCVCAIVDEE